MSALVKRDIEKTINYFGFIAKYLTIPNNEGQNQELIAFTRVLKKMLDHKDNEVIFMFLELIYKNIEAYEKHAYPIEPQSPEKILAFLMEQHDLTQSDLPEIGSQSHVSKILSGERNLTREQIGFLSKKFGVSPAIFYQK